MDANNQTFHEFRTYWQLSEELIADATKEELTSTAGRGQRRYDLAKLTVSSPHE